MQFGLLLHPHHPNFFFNFIFIYFFLGRRCFFQHWRVWKNMWQNKKTIPQKSDFCNFYFRPNKFYDPVFVFFFGDSLFFCASVEVFCWTFYLFLQREDQLLFLLKIEGFVVFLVCVSFKCIFMCSLNTRKTQTVIIFFFSLFKPKTSPSR